MRRIVRGALRTLARQAHSPPFQPGRRKGQKINLPRLSASESPTLAVPIGTHIVRNSELLSTDRRDLNFNIAKTGVTAI
jgi:hypothetical protein